MTIPDLPGPGSMTWQRLGRWATMSIALRGLVLQCAHPVVGAGVDEHSDFRTEFLPRLARTLTSTIRLVYDAPDEAAAEARRLRVLHAHIRGTDHQGRSYRALDPQAYAWVHAVMFESLVAYAELTGSPLTHAEQQRLYDEMKAIGTLLGVSEKHMPDTIDAFWTYFHHTVEHHLEDNTVVRDLLGPALPGLPPVPHVPALLWRAVWPPLARRTARLTAPALPGVYLRRLGLTVSATDARRSRRFFARVALVDRVLPNRYGYLPGVGAATRRRSAGASDMP